jgi:hypothetical protein
MSAPFGYVRPTGPYIAGNAYTDALGLTAANGHFGYFNDGTPYGGGFVPAAVAVAHGHPLTDVMGHTELVSDVQYHSRQQRLATMPHYTLFHQTSVDKAKQILSTQCMIRGPDGMCGGGIYFADSVEATNVKAREHGAVLAAKVKMGNTKRLYGPADVHFHSLLKEGFDSVTISRASGTEYVVYNYDQVYNIVQVA